MSIIPQYFRDISVIDNSGKLIIVEDFNIPFTVKRIYCLSDLEIDTIRGSHAHKKLSQIFLIPSGSCRIEIESNAGLKITFDLDNPKIGLYLPPGYWRTLSKFQKNTVVLVLASDNYDEGDYIRDYGQFKGYN